MEENLENSEKVETPKESQILDLLQTNGEIGLKAFHYKVNNGPDSSFMTVLAPSSSVARHGLAQQYPNTIFSYCGKSISIVQMNG